MNNSESVYGFVAWLTTRKESITLGASHDSAEPARLVKEFCELNGCAPISDDWPLNLVHPSGEGRE